MGRNEGLVVRVLGPVEAAVDGAPVPFRGPRQRALLAYLALRAGQAVSTERLAEDLWGEHPPANAGATLRTYISHLRAGLGDAGSALKARQPGYVLDVAPAAVDAVQFEALAAAGDWAGALSLWRGPLLAGVPVPDSLQGRAAHLTELRIACHEERVAADLDAGRHAAVIGELEALIAEHPLRERLRALLLVALYRSGRQADALRAYQAARTLLAEELGIEPGRELRELEAAILRHDPSLDRPAPAAAPSTPAPSAQAPSAPHPASSPASATRMLVGRDAEVAALHQAVASAANGTGRAVLVLGAAGIGKTRLLDALAGGLDGPAVLRARCDEAAGAPAFWAWVQVLRQALDGDATAEDTQGLEQQLALLAPTHLPPAEPLPELEPESARFLLFDAVTTFLARRAVRRPLVILLDDLHWADVSTVLLLSFVARRIRDLPIAVVATLRDDEVPADSALGLALASMASLPDVARIPLHGLTQDDVAAIVGPDQAEAIHRRTGGNPFFVAQLAAAPDLAAVPEGVKAVVTQRLSRLPAEARSVLAAAAVAGSEFSLVDVQRASGASREDVMRAIGSSMALGVVDPSEHSVAHYRFQHDLLRETAYDAIPVHERMALHARLAQAIEDADPAGDRLPEVARHLYQAAPIADAEKAVATLLKAADQAGSALAYEGAVELTEQALELLDLADRADDAARSTCCCGWATPVGGPGRRRRPAATSAPRPTWPAAPARAASWPGPCSATAPPG